LSLGGGRIGGREKATSHRIQDEPAYHPNFCVEFDKDVAVRHPTGGADFPGRMPDMKFNLVLS
jgi:hypothetical protein